MIYTHIDILVENVKNEKHQPLFKKMTFKSVNTFFTIDK